jgi:ribonuclease HI
MILNSIDRYEIIEYIKMKYKTLRGKPVESCTDSQLLAVYYSLLERKNKPTLNTQIAIKEKAMKTLYIYTDGACRNNQHYENLGAYAYKLIYGDKIKTFAQVIPNTTNNRMELQAVISALKAIKPTCRHYNIELYTDSMYVVKGFNEWLPTWIKKNFHNIKNETPWKELYALKTNFPNLKVEYIEGHAGHEHQEDADKLCNNALDNYENQL